MCVRFIVYTGIGEDPSGWKIHDYLNKQSENIFANLYVITPLTYIHSLCEWVIKIVYVYEYLTIIELHMIPESTLFKQQANLNCYHV